MSKLKLWNSISQIDFDNSQYLIPIIFIQLIITSEYKKDNLNNKMLYSADQYLYFFD